jgi:hypothetical protein
MAEILARLQRLPHESNLAFRERCGLVLLYSRWPESPGGGGVGRMTLSQGKNQMEPAVLVPDMAWGVSHQDADLPAGECILAQYEGKDARLKVHSFDANAYERAPVNPAILPRLPQRMSLPEYARAVTMVGPESGAGLYKAYLDGHFVNSFSVGSLIDALLVSHLRAVQCSLENCLSNEPGLARVLPSADALRSHPLPTEGPYASAFGPLLELSAQPLEWTTPFIEKARDEGCGIDVDADTGALSLYAIEGGPLAGQQAAWEILSNGRDAHQVFAMTLLSVLAPFEAARLQDAAHDHKPRPRESAGG